MKSHKLCKPFFIIEHNHSYQKGQYAINSHPGTWYYWEYKPYSALTVLLNVSGQAVQCNWRIQEGRWAGFVLRCVTMNTWINKWINQNFIMGDGVNSEYVRHNNSTKKWIKFHVNDSYCGRYSATVSTLSAFCNLSSMQWNSKCVTNSSHITSLIIFSLYWSKTTIHAAAIAYTITTRYCASYLSHTVEYINWILITCSVQIIAVFSLEHNFVNTTLVKVLFGHVRLYTNFPPKRGWLYVHSSAIHATDHLYGSV